MPSGRRRACLRGVFEIYRQLVERTADGMTEERMIDHRAGRRRVVLAELLFEGIFGPRREIYKRAAEFSHYQAEDVYSRVARRPFTELVSLSGRVVERLSQVGGPKLRQWMC